MLRRLEAMPGRRRSLAEAGALVSPEALLLALALALTAAVTCSRVFKTSSGQTKTAVAAPASEPATAETTSGSSQWRRCWW